MEISYGLALTALVRSVDDLEMGGGAIDAVMLTESRGELFQSLQNKGIGLVKHGGEVVLRVKNYPFAH